MAETLYIRLGSKLEDVIHWLIFSAAEQEIIASGELKSAAQLSELTEKSSQRQVNIIVPGSDVLLKQLTVPGKSQRSIRQAVPYMLEDELAQDVEKLFFSYADLPTDEQGNNCFTAVVEHVQMKRWLTWLADANITAKVLLPDILAMPQVLSKWSAIAIGQASNEQVIVRQRSWQGFTLDPITWWLQCEILSHEESSVERNGENVLIEAYSPLANSDKLGVTVMPEELPMALMAKHYTKSTFNLLQGEYKIKIQHGNLLRYWFSVAGIAACALLLSLGYKGAQLWQLNAQLDNVEQEIITTYKSTFPQEKRVRLSTIKSQLKQKLSAFGGGSDREGFLAVLVKVQPAFSKVPALKPSSLKFDGKRQELRLQATANGYQYFEQFKAALEASGLTVKQGAQKNQGEQVTGLFSIENKSNSSKRLQSNSTKKARGRN